MKRYLTLIAILIGAAIHAQAQMITWAVKLGVYSKIEPFSGDLYLVSQSDAVGIIQGNGKVVVAPEATRITGFYEGLALVLKAEGGKERILGFFSDDGTYTPISGTYYTIPYQEFFSDGLLTVTNARGQGAYMNANGAIVQSFKESFVSPFSEGYAVVGEEKDFRLIDKRFKTLSIQLGTVARLYGGSNVYNGKAVLWDENGVFYEYNVNQGSCRKIREPNSTNYDYMYCFSSITHRPETVPYERPKRMTETLAATRQGDKYGYFNQGSAILPCQFDEAESFFGDHAIVVKGSRYALLELHRTDETFKANVSTPTIQYKRGGGKNLAHKFTLSIPSEWRNSNLQVGVRDRHGAAMSVTNNGNKYEFKSDGASGQHKYNVEVECDGLSLWTGEIAYNYKEEVPQPIIIDDNHQEHVGGVLKPLTVSVSVKKEADANNHCNVVATIRNPNSDAITATVTFKGSNLLEACSKRITIPGHGSQNVSTHFTVRKAAAGQSVTVTTSAGGSATASGLQLIPF